MDNVFYIINDNKVELSNGKEYSLVDFIDVLVNYINQLEKGSYIEEGINGQWTNWKFEAENYKKVCDDLYKKVSQLETNRDEALEYLKYALDEEKETPSKYNDWRLDLLEILERGKE